MAEDRRVQLELWRQEKLKAKQAVGTTTVAIQRRVVVPPKRAAANQSAAGKTTLKRKATAAVSAPLRMQRVKTTGSVSSRTGSVDSLRSSTSEEIKSEATVTSTDAAAAAAAGESIEIRGDSDFVPPSAEKLHKEKRRTSFILPSPTNIPALAGGAKRILTPTRSTPSRASAAVTAASANEDSGGSERGKRQTPGARQLYLAPQPETVATATLPEAKENEDDEDQTTEEAEAILEATETDTDARSVRTTLSFGAISRPLRVLNQDDASDEEDAFGDFTFPTSKSKLERVGDGDLKAPDTSTSTEHASSDASAVRTGQSLKGPVRVLAPTTLLGSTLGAARRVSVGDTSGRRSLDEVKPARTLEERLDQHSKWEMSDFTVTKNLGKGKFGNVYLAKEKHSNVTVALKVLYKSPLILEGGLKNLQREVEIQHRLLHPNILRLHGYFYDDSCVYLVLEYASHGELYKLLSKQRQFSEALAAHYIAQVVDALDYLHSCHVIHRDIKPENLLMGANHTIKLADFGWSVHAMNQYAKRKTFCGTPDYLSPEVLLGEEYDHRVDVWSLGVLAFEFLFGSTPFHVDNQVEMYKRIESVDFRFPLEPPVSESARRFIAGLLQRNPADRMSLQQARQHDWLAKRPSI